MAAKVGNVVWIGRVFSGLVGVDFSMSAAMKFLRVNRNDTALSVRNALAPSS